MKRLECWLRGAKCFPTARSIYRRFKDIRTALSGAWKKSAFELRRPWLHRKRAPIIRKYLSENGRKKLQIGCGSNPFNGWLNTDYYPKSDAIAFLDCTEPLPFAENTFDYIFSEHMIEHIRYQQALTMLKECCRVLRPGEKIRVSTPDLGVLLGLFTDGPNETQKSYLEWMRKNLIERAEIESKQDACVLLNLVMRGWGHFFLYDFPTLKEALEKAGFTDVRRYACGESQDENLKGLERHGEFIGNPEMNSYETLVVEASKQI